MRHEIYLASDIVTNCLKLTLLFMHFISGCIPYEVFMNSAVCALFEVLMTPEMLLCKENF